MKSFILDNEADLFDWMDFVKENSKDINVVGFDLETDGVEEVRTNIYGIGLAFQEDEGFYIPLRNKQGEFFFGEGVAQQCVEFVSDLLRSKQIIAHNGVFDTLVWKHRTGIDLSQNLHADTILMKHCLNENPPFGLKDVAVQYLGPWADKAQQALYENIKANGGSVTKDNLQMFKADTAILGEYCCWDVMLTYKLYNLFSVQLKEEGLEKFFYDEEVMPLYREVTIKMKEKGIPVDLNYFETLKAQISEDIEAHEAQVMDAIEGTIAEFTKNLLADKAPIKKTGTYPKVYASLIGFQLDSLARKVIEKLVCVTPVQENFREWMLGNTDTLTGPVDVAQSQLFFSKYPGQNYVFNLRSKSNLKSLFFEVLGEEPLSRTETGEPQVDDEFLSSVENKYEWVKTLRDLNKLEKIKGTYIEGILERAIDSVIYASLLQFGTTSGRYASRNPNLQNLPRPKEDDAGLSEIVLRYNNAIRAGFVSPKGYVFVDADYSALEPRAFAHMSGDKNLQLIFHSGEDMYSAIAKRIFKMEDVGTFKKDANFLGKLHPEKRQMVKAMALAVTYGAEAFRIGDLLGKEREEAQQLIDDYLSSYPGLKNYIQTCHYETNKQGFVKTIFGRVRHLRDAKNIFDEYGHKILDSRWAKSKGLKDTRRTYKNLLNNSTNFKIQGLAAHIVNRAMIKINREFNNAGIDGWVSLQVHDQVVATVRKDQAEQAVKIVQECMENIVQLSVPLVAEPKIAHNLRDSH